MRKKEKERTIIRVIHYIPEPFVVLFVKAVYKIKFKSKLSYDLNAIEGFYSILVENAGYALH